MMLKLHPMAPSRIHQRNIEQNFATGTCIGFRLETFLRQLRLTLSRLPDASVPLEQVASDIASIASVGAGGLEFLPFYLYGLPTSTRSQTPTDWNKYGFGTGAFQSLFKGALRAVKQSDMLMDFGIGANQGQGVPAEPLTEGLAVQLLMGNTTVKSGQRFTGVVPPPLVPSEEIMNGAGFMHPLERFGPSDLKAVLAFRVNSEAYTDITTNGVNFSIPIVYLEETSAVDLTSLVDEDGRLNWMVPSGNSSWRIFSFWQEYTNQRSVAGAFNATSFVGNGSWTVDHFSKKGAQRVTEFFDDYIIVDEETTELLKSVGSYAWEDSMEIMSTLYWTPDLIDRFEKSRGYSITKYLPLLFTYQNTWFSLFPPYSEMISYGNYTTDGTSVHQLDYRETLNEGYQDYISHFETWSHSRGFEYSNQPAYNLPLQMLSDIPLVDAPEF
ncbi:hypothetical protein TCE0_037f12250 [Talaromyces pinophilus]|uniref:Uncharacterized protein n=1 Tax=Talaromyces pinophilus TaxID=128442 RepID=A0A0B8MXV8_TALPI|nr:hypothetical protein TCE0_037f12250 [Talaromyces pinophilus]